MIWAIIIGVIFITLFRFLTDLNKDNYDLQGQSLAEKFKFIVEYLNEAAFQSNGRVVYIDKRSFNLWKDGSNQIILFNYGTGHLTITWNYKYFQKEVVHERVFKNVRNLSLFEQQKIATLMINEMQVVVLDHQRKVGGNIF